MAGTKISALTDGSPPQGADEIAVARAGANFKLSLTNLFGKPLPFGLITQAAENGLTAHAGGGKGSALALDATKNLHRVTAVATANDSILMPPALVGQAHYVRNSAANAMQVFGQGTDTINSIATGTGISHGGAMGCFYTCEVAGNWSTSAIDTITATKQFLAPPSGVTYACITDATSGISPVPGGAGVYASGVNVWSFDTVRLFPRTDNAYDIGTAAFRVRDYFGGGALMVAAPASATASTYTVGAHDYSITANFAGTQTATLPAAASFTGRIIKIRTITANTVISASSNVVPLAGGAAGTAILAATAGKWAELQSDGSNWQIIAAN